MSQQSFAMFSGKWLEAEAEQLRHKPVDVKLGKRGLTFRFDGLTPGLAFSCRKLRHGGAEIVGSFALNGKYFWDIVFEVAVWQGYFTPTSYHCVCCSRQFPQGCQPHHMWRHLLSHLKDLINAISDETMFGVNAAQTDCGAVHFINLDTTRAALPVLNVRIPASAPWPDFYLFMTPVAKGSREDWPPDDEWPVRLPWYTLVDEEVVSLIERQKAVLDEPELLAHLHASPLKLPLAALDKALPNDWQDGEFRMVDGHVAEVKSAATSIASYRLTTTFDSDGRYVATSYQSGTPILPPPILQRIANLMHYARHQLVHLHRQDWYREITDSQDVTRYLFEHADAQLDTSVRYLDRS